jgi:antitoxin component YwqK of YwqJK toxin-antitoxin module
MLGYAIAKNKDTRVVVTLEIPSDALTNTSRPVVNKDTAVFRASKAKVLKIEEEGGRLHDTAMRTGTKDAHDMPLEYKVGEIVEEPNYIRDIYHIHEGGIRYYLSKFVAETFQHIPNYCRNGIYEQWHSDGAKMSTVTLVDGKRHGIGWTYNQDGGKQMDTWVDGTWGGPVKTYYPSGKIKEEYVHKSKLYTGLTGEVFLPFIEGIYTSWYENGQKKEEVLYVEGEMSGFHHKWHENGEREHGTMFYGTEGMDLPSH